MKIERCINGHFYDAERFARCPHCFGPERPDIPERFRAFGEPVFAAKGSSAFVYRFDGARDVVLKITPCGADPKRFSAAIRERAFLERLSDTGGVVTLIDSEVSETNGERTVYLLEKACTPLNDWLITHTLTLKDALRIAIRICDALIACRDKGVLHLDVQPKNVFLDGDAVRLGDFSSASDVREASETRLVRGTPAYAAPEVLREGRCGEQSDLYAVGIILYTLLNDGNLPFANGKDSGAAIEKRTSKMPLPPVHAAGEPIDRVLNRILQLACAPDTGERYARFEQLREALLGIFEKIDEKPESKPLITAEPPWLMIDDDPMATSALPFQTANGPDSPYRQTLRVEDDAERQSAISDLDTLPPDAPLPSYMSGAVEQAPKPPHMTNEIERAPLPPYMSGAVEQAPKPDAVGKNVAISEVAFSAVAPRTVARGDYTIIHVVMYEKAFRHIVDEWLADAGTDAQEARSGIHTVQSGAEVRVTLQSPDLAIGEDTEVRTWRKGYLDFAFDVCLPETYPKRQILFRATVWINDVIATRLKFAVKCSALFEQRIRIEREDVTSAFVSYASQDRNRVAAILQGMKIARPDLDVFFDVESLRSGDAWQRTLQNEIDRRDVLFLCWSRHARDSRWVDAEWRYALERKGEEGIEPVPIESPDVCPPPDELSHKHFNDKLLYIINAGGNA